MLAPTQVETTRRRGAAMAGRRRAATLLEDHGLEGGPCADEGHLVAGEVLVAAERAGVIVGRVAVVTLLAGVHAAVAAGGGDAATVAVASRAAPAARGRSPPAASMRPSPHRTGRPDSRKRRGSTMARTMAWNVAHCLSRRPLIRTLRYLPQRPQRAATRQPRRTRDTRARRGGHTPSQFDPAVLQTRERHGGRLVARRARSPGGMRTCPDTRRSGRVRPPRPYRHRRPRRDRPPGAADGTLKHAFCHVGFLVKRGDLPTAMGVGHRDDCQHQRPGRSSRLSVSPYQLDSLSSIDYETSRADGELGRRSHERDRSDRGGESYGRQEEADHDVGRPVVDNQNVLTAGPRGPQLLQDVWFLEKLAHFDREVIPERRMHAKGSGAYGTFTVTHDITATREPRSSPRSARRPNSSPASPPWRASAVRPTPSATSAASPSSSTRRKATGTWSATTRRCSSCATR